MTLGSQPCRSLLFRGSNPLFPSQLSDSAEEDSADLKKAQKGEWREVPGCRWGRREVGFQPAAADPQCSRRRSGLWALVLQWFQV